MLQKIICNFNRNLNKFKLSSFLDFRGAKKASDHNAKLILLHSTAYPLKIKDGKILCLFCKKVFSDPSLFRLHVDSERPTISVVNLFKATRGTGYSTTRVDITNLRCKKCVGTFPCLTSLSRHLIDKHDIEVDPNYGFGLVPLLLETDRFVCVVCKKRFNSRLTLYRHSGSHFLSYKCDKCSKMCASPAQLRVHKLSHGYHCRRCKKTFASAEEKKQHFTLKQCRPYCTCSECGHQFSCWEHKQRHMETVHGHPKAVHRCHVCSVEFKTRIAVYLHFKANHTEDHKCEICGQSLSTKERLQEHVASHTGDRPYQCTVCGKSFSKAKALRQHHKIHDDSKKMSCTACGKLFVGKSKLRNHVKARHPDVYLQEFGKP